MRALNPRFILLIVAATPLLSAASPRLSSYNIDPAEVAVAGISSGADMAVQLHVAFSSSFPRGAAVFAGGPYNCAQGSLLAASTVCSQPTLITPAAETSVAAAQSAEARGQIDATANLSTSKVYLFSGIFDEIIHTAVMDALAGFYSHFLSSTNIIYNRTTPAAHGWISPDATTACGILSLPFLNNCGIDPEEAFLTLFFGPLSPKTGGTLSGRFLEFDQNEFSGASMDQTGWAYVPNTCALGSRCRLLMALHGCLQGRAVIGGEFIENSGLNEWADANNILVIYPQAVASLANPDGCWDWWGYTGPDYAIRSGSQMQALKKILDRAVNSYQE